MLINITWSFLVVAQKIHQSVPEVKLKPTNIFRFDSFAVFRLPGNVGGVKNVIRYSRPVIGWLGLFDSLRPAPKPTSLCFVFPVPSNLQPSRGSPNTLTGWTSSSTPADRRWGPWPSRFGLVVELMAPAAGSATDGTITVWSRFPYVLVWLLPIVS